MKNFITSFTVISFGLFVVSCSSPIKAPTSEAKSNVTNSEPRIVISLPGHEIAFTRAQLLADPHLEDMTVEKDPAYGGHTKTYRAIPLWRLFEGKTVSTDATLLFSCLDGFSAPISAERVLNHDPKKSIAYIAVESPAAPWPAIKPKASDASAGPFYLIWQHPEKSKVVIEEWPFQLAGFTVKPSIESQFPHIAPSEKIGANDPVRKGYKLFTQNCFACHTMNGDGAAQMGPDLNIPFNPTEYLRPGFLKKQIRNPQSVKRWTQGKMPPFKPDGLSDADITAIEAYLKHMTKRKI